MPDSIFSIVRPFFPFLSFLFSVALALEFVVRLISHCSICRASIPFFASRYYLDGGWSGAVVCSKCRGERF